MVKTANLVNQTVNRTLDKVYQNTTGKYLLVIVTAGLASDAIYGKISSDNVTWEIVIKVSTSTNFYSALLFVVPPNYYYQVSTDAALANLYYWWEVEI